MSLNPISPSQLAQTSLDSDLKPIFKKISFLDKVETQDLKKFFNDQDPENYFRETVNNRWGLKKAKSTWVQLEVLFDSKGSVKHQTLTLSYRHYKH